MSELAQARDIAAALLSFDPNTPCDEVRKTMERHNQDCCLRVQEHSRGWTARESQRGTFRSDCCRGLLLYVPFRDSVVIQHPAAAHR
jgi:hypothetical protein